MLAKVYMTVFIIATAFQLYSMQSITLTRPLLVQMLGDGINKKSINLNEKQIAAIERDTFAGLTQVTDLYLSNNQLTTIENYYFKDLVNLELLVLEFNKIGKIAPDAFTGLNNLRDMYFHMNQVNL